MSYVWTFLGGAVVGAGGIGFLWWRYSARLTAWAAQAGVTLPK